MHQFSIPYLTVSYSVHIYLFRKSPFKGQKSKLENLKKKKTMTNFTSYSILTKPSSSSLLVISSVLWSFSAFSYLKSHWQTPMTLSSSFSKKKKEAIDPIEYVQWGHIPAEKVTVGDKRGVSNQKTFEIIQQKVEVAFNLTFFLSLFCFFGIFSRKKFISDALPFVCYLFGISSSETLIEFRPRWRRPVKRKF